MDFKWNLHLPNAYDALPGPLKINHSQLLNLSSNEVIHPKIEKLLEAFIHHCPLENLSRYPRWEDYHHEFSKFFKVSAQELTYSAGMDQAIAYLLAHLTKQKTVIIQSPTFPNYYSYAAVNNLNITHVNCTHKSDDIFVKEFTSALAVSQPGVAILTTPNGLTGHSLKPSDVAVIAEAAVKHNHILIIDEAYADYAVHQHLSLIHSYPNVIILRTFSKGFGLAGLRMGILLGNEKLVNFIKKTGIFTGVSSFTLACTSYLIQHYSNIVEIRTELLKTKALFIQKIRNSFPQWQVLDGDGNFVTLNLKSAKRAENLCKFLENHGILIKDLSAYQGLEGHVRITVAETKKLNNVFEKCVEFNAVLLCEY